MKSVTIKTDYQMTTNVLLVFHTLRNVALGQGRGDKTMQKV